MNEDLPVIICVAPNGARKTKLDHPALPISPEELAIEAEICMKAGASMIHLHVRDEDGNHTIGAKYYRPAIAAIRRKVGDGLIIQATTEAVGIYTTHEQMRAVKDLKPEAVSLALKELCPEGGEDKAKDFFAWVLAHNIAPQYILYSAEDVQRFINLHEQGIIPDAVPHILFVLGRYSVGMTSDPKDLSPMLGALGDFNAHWAVCAFGAKEMDCMSFAAQKKGPQHRGHCRIGFENNMYLPSGLLAKNNADLIKRFADQLSYTGRSFASPEEARHTLGMTTKGEAK